jgi:hypothetical protein
MVLVSDMVTEFVRLIEFVIDVVGVAILVVGIELDVYETLIERVKDRV